MKLYNLPKCNYCLYAKKKVLKIFFFFQSYWKVLGFEGTASRKLIMVVLQNVTDILLLAKHDRYIQSLS